MRGLLADVQNTLNVPCYTPGNLEHLLIHVNVEVPLKMEYKLIQELRETHHISFVDGIFGDAERTPQIECNITDDWILQDNHEILFSCDLCCSLNRLKSLLPQQVLDFLTVEETTDNKLLLTWDAKDDSQVSDAITELQNHV